MALTHPDASTEAPIAPLLGQPRPTQNPLPKAQLAVVYTIKLLVPLVSLQILPYLNQMIEESHLSSARTTGYYSGLVGSTFTQRVWPLAFVAFPLPGWLVRRGFVALWPAIAGVIFLNVIGWLTFGLVKILVKENTPAPDALGAANELFEFLQMVGVGIGFTFFRSLDSLGKFLWVFVIVALSALEGLLAGLVHE